MPTTIQLSHDDLVALLRRTTDADGWLNPILANPTPAAVMGAVIEVFARAARAASYNGLAGLISSAPGGNFGGTTARVARAASGTSGTIPAGYPFVDRRGAILIARTNVPVGAGDLVASVPLQTLRETEAINTEDDPALAIAAFAPTTLDGGAVTVLIAAPGAAGVVSTTFQAVVDADPIQGGASDWLSVRGSERSVIRQSGEDEASYRARVRSIPDAVSPLAIARGVQAVVSRLGLPPFDVLEPFNDGADPALKDPVGLGDFSGIYLSASTDPATSDYLDDPLGGRELVDRRTAIAYLRVSPTVPGIQIPEDAIGLFLDDDSFLDDPFLGFLGLGDELSDPAVLGNFLAIVQEVDSKRAAGVQFDVFATEASRIVGHGTSNVAAEQVAFTLLPPAGGFWLWQDAWFDHDFSAWPSLPTGYPPAFGHAVRITYDDLSSFETPMHFGYESERLTFRNLLALGFPSRPVVKVEGIVLSDGVHQIGMVGTLFVVEVLP